MSMAYDTKYKLRAIEFHEEGNPIRQTAKVFKISPNTLNTWLKEYREKGEFITKPRVRNNAKVTEQGLLSYLENNPDAYQYEMAEHFGVSQASIWKGLRRFKITRKKR